MNLFLTDGSLGGYCSNADGCYSANAYCSNNVCACMSRYTNMTGTCIFGKCLTVILLVCYVHVIFDKIRKVRIHVSVECIIP